MSNGTATMPTSAYTRHKFKNEDALIEKVREHLREAANNGAIKRMAFTFEFNNGRGTVGNPGVTKHTVDLTVQYNYVENSGAV